MSAYIPSRTRVRAAMTIVREAYALAFLAELSTFQSIEVESLLREFAKKHHDTLAEIPAPAAPAILGRAAA